MDSTLRYGSAMKTLQRSDCARQAYRKLACLLVLCLVLVPSHRVWGQQSQQQITEAQEDTTNPPGPTAENEEESTKERSLFEIDLPLLPGVETPAEPVQQPTPPTPSEAELREDVRRLQQDVEMLKEEIAALRAELRAIVPKVTEQETVKTQPTTPFWITDSQLQNQPSDKAR